jgi:hypothetical protein
MGEESKRREGIAHKQIESMPGAVMLKLDDKELARWHARLRPIAEEWAKTRPDGDKILAAYRAEIAKRKGS